MQAEIAVLLWNIAKYIQSLAYQIREPSQRANVYVCLALFNASYDVSSWKSLPCSRNWLISGCYLRSQECAACLWVRIWCRGMLHLLHQG